MLGQDGAWAMERDPVRDGMKSLRLPLSGAPGLSTELQAVGKGEGFKVRPVDLLRRDVEILGQGGELLVVEAFECPGEL